MSGEDGMPWARALAYAVSVLRLSPEAFWRLSLWEWQALMGAAGEGAPTPAELRRLMRLHPDRSMKEDRSHDLA